MRSPLRWFGPKVALFAKARSRVEASSGVDDDHVELAPPATRWRSIQPAEALWVLPVQRFGRPEAR